MEVTLNGERLGDAQEIILYDAGIQVTKLEVPTNQANNIKAQIKIASDCPLGEHLLRVRCASGISDIRSFWVGQFPTVNEAEPNTEFDKAQKIPLNVTVEGVIENEDVDFYLVEAKKGHRISVEVEGMRLGRALFDPYCAIMNTNRFVLASSDDTALLLQDPTCYVVAPDDGQYLIQIRDTTYGGNGNCRYRAHIGTFPRPTGVFPAGGKVGETITVKFLGDVGGEFSQQVKLPDAPQEKFPVFAEQNAQSAPSPNWLRVSSFPNVLEVEPNKDKEHATVAHTETPLAFNGVISENGDVDWHRFKAKKDQVIEVNVFARRLRSPLDSVLNVYKSDGGGLAGNDDSAGADSYLKFTAPADGDYLLRITDHLNKGGPDYFYRIELAATTPQLTLSVPDVSRNNAQERKSIAVPRGNRFGMVVQVKRENFGGDLAVQALDLPNGITLQCENIAANQTTLPIVFEATPDAPIAGKLCDLIAKHADPKQNITGNIHQPFAFIRGDPGDSIYSQTAAEKIAAAVVEEVPFKINIVEPKVPLVRGGTMDLKVVAERKPGFDEPITLKMLHNPSGVGSADEVVIPKGEANALYRLNANGGAELRSWKIAVIGRAKVKDADTWISSQLATLTIGEPFVTMKIEMASAEPGQSVRVVCNLDQKAPFDGKATCKLLGLPNGATAPDTEFTKDDKQVVFDVATSTNTPAGQHKSLFCAITITKGGEPIPHSIGGGGVLRIDKPKPVQVAEVKKEEKPAAAPGTAEKPLTRLEKLRLEQAEREKLAKGSAK